MDVSRLFPPITISPAIADLSTEEKLDKCDEAITKMAALLAMGRSIPVLQSLKRIRSGCTNIEFVLKQLLPFGDLLFYRYMKSEARNLLNHFDTYDTIFHSVTPATLKQLFDFDILEPHYAAKINGFSLRETLCFIVQFAEYDETFRDYILGKFTGLICKNDIYNHILFRNIANEIVIYMKACQNDDKLSAEFVNITEILHTYQCLEDKNEGSPMLNSRLLNTIRMIVKAVKNAEYILPTLEQFQREFARYYNINDIEGDWGFVTRLPADFYEHIQMLISTNECD